MHELAITENVLEMAIGEAKRHGAKKVALIRLRVGEMTQVDPTCVEFYLGLIAKGTIAEGVKLEAERVPLLARCRACGSEFAVAAYDFACPRCGHKDTEIISGRELYVDSIEIE